MANELYVSGCVLHRLDATFSDEHANYATKRRDAQIARYFLSQSRRRIARSLEDLWDNDDAETTAIADLALRGSV